MYVLGVVGNGLDGALARGCVRFVNRSYGMVLDGVCAGFRRQFVRFTCRTVQMMRLKWSGFSLNDGNCTNRVGYLYNLSCSAKYTPKIS